MITERSIINALIILGVLIVMPFIISSALIEFDYRPVAIVVGVATLMVSFFVIKDRLSFCPLLALSFHGILAPINASLSNVACLVLILYYVTGYVLIRQKRIRLGMPRFFWPMLVILLIMLYHNHNLNVRLFGAEGGGQKPVLLMYLTVLAYFCGINLATPTTPFVSKLPWYMIVISFISSIPYAITTVVPGLAPYVALLTNQVNPYAYAEANSDVVSNEDEGQGERTPILGFLASPIQTYLLSYYPIGTWIRPDRWWVAGLSLICMYGTLLTGFRNSIFFYAITVLAATWCYYSWRALVIPIAIFTFLMVLITASSNSLISVPVNHLPKVVQRSMSFLPGDWDKDVLQSAESSNFFRQNIINVYMQEYARKSPWIGNGYDINMQLFNEYGASLFEASSRDERNYYQAKMFIEGKMFHTGWLGLYDAVGFVGGGAFLILILAELYTLAQWIFEPKVDRRSSLFPCYVWLFSSLVSFCVGFFVVFGDFSQAVQTLLVYAIVISQIDDLRKVSDIPDARTEADAGSEFTRPGGGRYGYGYPARY